MNIVEKQHDLRVLFTGLEDGTVFDGMYIKGKRYAENGWVICYTSLYTGQVHDVAPNEMKGDEAMRVYPNASATLVLEGLE